MIVWRECRAVGNLVVVVDCVKPRLVLYTTAACTMCEEALDRLFNMSDPLPRALLTLDVAEDDALFQRYAQRVPVLACGSEELDWPFDEADIRRLVDLSARSR